LLIADQSGRSAARKVHLGAELRRTALTSRSKFARGPEMFLPPLPGSRAVSERGLLLHRNSDRDSLD